MTAPLRVGVAGLGVVGSEVVRLLAAQADLIATRCGRRIEVVAVSARERARDRGLSLQGIRWIDDAPTLAADPGVDVVAELIGGAEGVARQLVENALTAGKSVVTANKALLAHHGAALARQAESKGVTLAFEASVAGGIPIVKMLREGFAGNQIKRVYGILNGTCNYILTAMRDSRREFRRALAEAQKLGYAEADPTFDIEGIDTAHKLALLASVAFGSPVDFEERDRAAAALDAVGIPDARRRMDDYPHQFSGGMRQRVMIAMAMVCDPAILVADEPTTALDVTIQAQVLELMLDQQRRREGAALLLITHDLAVIAETCHRVIVMYGGKIQEEAPVVELFENPLHPYTRGLLRSIPGDGERGRRLTAIRGNVPSIFDLPDGCKFCTRCPEVMDRCWTAEPELVEVSPGHRVRCFLHEERP